MPEFSVKTVRLFVLVLGMSLVGFSCASAYGKEKAQVTKVKPKKKNKADVSQSAEPDKVLYDRAMGALQHSKFVEARLDLQTLINTYPDSEYLAKAKLATADSFYKEGGTSNLTQAVDEYKNFIVFFPFLDEAAYAQMQVAMCHYRLMEKPDRDSSQAESAEDEFRTFLLKYPRSPLVPNAEQYLRNVQQVLAEGEYRIAHFYYMKQDYRASAARLVELTGRYPLYSQSDVALFMLGNIYGRAKQASRNEDDKNHWGDLAGKCYSRIVKDYPLSNLVPEAKTRLTSMAMPVPKPDPEALARMQKQQDYEKGHHANPLLAMPMGMIRSSPDVHEAARLGPPDLNPPDDTISATEVLNEGAAGPKFNIAASIEPTGANPQTSDTESVETSDLPHASTNAQAADQPAAAPAVPSTAAAPSTMTSLPSAAPSAGAAGTAEPPIATENSAPPAAADANSLSPTSAAAPSAQGSPQSKEDSKSESSSKKKKGLHKLIP